MSPDRPSAAARGEVRVFLLDDHEEVRRGVRELLSAEEDLEVVGEASTAREALEGIAQLQPDVALLDVRVADGNGIEVCREVRSTMPAVACVLLTSYADDKALLATVLAGASGYVLKQIRGNDLVGSVRRAARGESLLAPPLVAAARSRLFWRDERVSLGQLGDQERRVFELTAASGATNWEIAAQLVLVESSVRQHVSNLLLRLDMKGEGGIGGAGARRERS